MINGFAEYPDFFPSADPASLADIFQQYKDASTELAMANARAATAAVKKKDRLKALQTAMKSQIKIAEVDCVSNPDRLGFIGWGQAALPSDIPAPDQPTRLVIDAQGFDAYNKKGIIQLSWRKPDNLERKHIRYYSVERKMLCPGEDGHVGPWQQAGTCIDDQIILKNEPTGVRLEYQVRAVNKAGQSKPSNVAYAVL
jgi:hypothetical protein